MTSIFNKIHRLKQLGWSWDDFLTEIEKHYPAGMDEKTLYAHYRNPHRKPTNHVSQIINDLHDQYFPDPFPEDINRLMRLYNHLHDCKKHLAKIQDVQDLEFFIKAQLNRETKSENLRLSRLNWLLGNISFDRIPDFRQANRDAALQKTKLRAINHYQLALHYIEEHNLSNPQHAVAIIHLYKARQNILACHLNSVKQDVRRDNQALLEFLQQSDYIQNSKHTLEAEPFQWSVARNGLRFSSLLKNTDDIKLFFHSLISINKRFLDLKYKPLNNTAIADGKDFSWAIENVLSQTYISNLRNE